MTRNKRPQNRHTPIRLEMDGRLYGHYADVATALKIARSVGTYWRIWRGDTLVDEAS